jgi:KDO2-lipid IV(A) lauroyltransferase
MRIADIPIADTAAPEPPAPPLRDLLRRGAAGAAARRFHVAQRIEGWAQILAHELFRLLPPRLVSAIGAMLGRRAWRRRRGGPLAARMDRMLARFTDLDAAARVGVVERWFENAGRVYAEYAVMTRVANGGTVRVEGLGHLRAAHARTGQIAFASCHLGPWEMTGALLRRFNEGEAVFSKWAPQADRYQNRIVWRRRRREGTVVLPPTPGVTRTVHRLFVDGRQHICLFVDEVFDGASRFPPFWRPMPDRGNATLLLKLARRTGAPVLPLWLRREQDGVLTLVVRPALPLDPALDEAAYLAEGRRLLAAVFEPVLRAHPDQWYMLSEMRDR